MHSTSDRPTNARLTTLIDNCFVKVSRAMNRGASGPEASTLLVRLLVTHFDRVYTGEGCTKSHTFGVCNDTAFSDFSREFRVLGSAVTDRVSVFVSGDGCGFEGG